MAEESIILSGITTLREIGFFDFLLPFILFFAVIYGVLSKAKIFSGPGGEERKDINAVIAFVIALIATTTSWVLLSLNYFLPWIGFIVIVILGFLILGSMAVGGDITPTLVKYAPYGVPIIALTVFAVMFFALGWDKMLQGTGIAFSNTDIALIIMGIVGVIVFAVIIKSGGAEASPKKEG
jgi:hypothetical protein